MNLLFCDAEKTTEHLNKLKMHRTKIKYTADDYIKFVDFANKFANHNTKQNRC